MRLPLPPLSLPTALLLAAATLTAGVASAGPASRASPACWDRRRMPTATAAIQPAPMRAISRSKKPPRP